MIENKDLNKNFSARRRHPSSIGGQGHSMNYLKYTSFTPLTCGYASEVSTVYTATIIDARNVLTKKYSLSVVASAIRHRTHVNTRYSGCTQSSDSSVRRFIIFRPSASTSFLNDDFFLIKCSSGVNSCVMRQTLRFVKRFPESD